MADAAQWLKGNEMCIVTLWNGAPLTVAPPNFVELVITETDPGVKGDTAGSGGKPATLETGAVVRVPLFVPQGDKIKVDTRTGESLSFRQLDDLIGRCVGLLRTCCGPECSMVHERTRPRARGRFPCGREGSRR